PLGVCAQSAKTPNPAFEAASIKSVRDSGSALVCSGFAPCTSECFTISGARVQIHLMSLYQLIARAYRTKPYQLSGPNWMTTQAFDIVAKMPEGASKDQIPQMLQTLLAERFGLSVHREKKALPVYALVTNSNGVRPKVATGNPNEISVEQSMYTPFGEA